MTLSRLLDTTRSSNRTCRFPASGFPTGFTADSWTRLHLITAELQYSQLAKRFDSPDLLVYTQSLLSCRKWPVLALLSFSGNRPCRRKRPAQFRRYACGRHLSVLPSHARYLLRPRGHKLGPAPIFEMHGEVRLRDGAQRHANQHLVKWRQFFEVSAGAMSRHQRQAMPQFFQYGGRMLS